MDLNSLSNPDLLLNDMVLCSLSNAYPLLNDRDLNSLSNPDLPLNDMVLCSLSNADLLLNDMDLNLLKLLIKV